MTTVYHYQVYCVQEAKYVETWGTTAPTLCPNNHADRTINNVAIIEIVTKNTVTVEEPSTGYFQTESIIFDIPSGISGEETSHEVKWPMNILMWKSILSVDASSIGDIFSVVADPEKIVGVITQELTSGNNVISTNVALVGALATGFELLLTSNGTTQNMGRVTHLDKVNGTITLENNATSTFPAGSIIKINVYIAKNINIFKENDLTIGEKGFKGKIIDANTILRVNYKNNTGTAKKMIWRVEYYLTN